MKIRLLGVKINAVSKSQALYAVCQRIRQKRYTVIYTPNPIMVSHALRDGKFRRILNRAHLNLPDGVGLVLAAKILGLPLTERVAGIELGEALLSLAEREGLRVFLLGAKPHIADLAAQKLKKKHPRLIVCGTHHGYFREDDTPKICERIASTRTDILLVCLGSPRQERWIAANHPRGVLVAAALGGSLDVWAGNVTRAPRVLSRLGLEWLWRMCLEPRRFSGLADITVFLAAVLRERLTSHKKGTPERVP